MAKAKKTFTRTDEAKTKPVRPAPTPNVPIRAADHPLVRWGKGERFASDDLSLADLGGATQIGVSLTVIPPGKASCPFHWHLLEEEHFYVLEGRVTLRSGADRYPMAAGDYVCFPAGTRVAHGFENESDAPCRILSIGGRNPNEIAVYPDSGKMKLRALRTIVPFGQESLDYWAGERPEQPIGKRRLRSRGRGASS